MNYEYTFILPTLNEENSIKFCIDEIKASIRNYNLNAEILVTDNGSTDNTVSIARKSGARVVFCKEKGYGANLINGTQKAWGKYCFMGDSDGSYDFTHLDDFLNELKNGYDLVVGNRFLGGIQKNAMPFSHKIGVAFLTKTANMFFHTPIHDYHCGLRAYNRNKLLSLNLQCSGMEYASEMIIKAKQNDLSMIEVSTILRKDIRGRKPHLRTIRDGFRHLFLIFQLFLTTKKAN